jgi:DNA-binding LytR/AlgR family response regulator
MGEKYMGERMIKIAVVEDNVTERKRINSYLNDYATTKKREFSITNFNDGLEFIEGYANLFDIVFLDIEMPRMNGLTAAKQFRKLDENAIIIFVTNLTQYAIQGYEVDAMNYLVKPIKSFTFNHALDKAIIQINKNADNYLIFKVDGILKKVNANNILYLEAFGHDIVCHGLSEDFSFPSSLNELESQTSVAPYNFIRIHRSIIVNPKHIREVRTNTIVVGDAQLPISRNQKKCVLECLLKAKQL